MRPARAFSGPVGSLYLATLVLQVGGGAWFTCWAIFLTRVVGLSIVEFGVGLTIAAVVGLAVGAPLGYLADRIGTRETLVVVGVVDGLAVLGFLLVDGMWSFVAVACVAVTAERALPAVRMAVIAGLTEGSDRIRVMSTNRVLAHVGMAVGAAVGAFFLTVGDRRAFVALVLLYATSSLAAAVLARRVPHVSSLLDRRESRGVLALRDPAFLVITVLTGVLALNWGMLSTGVPLWITTRTTAPAWTVGMITLLNAVAIVVFQNRVSRIGDTVAGAARAAALCGLALAASCLLFALTPGTSGVLLVATLLLAAVAQVVGELYYSTASWGLSTGLTRREAHGEYQAVFATGYTAAVLFAPAVMTVLVIGWGVAGWITLAALFLVSAVPVAPVSRWAQRSGVRADATDATRLG